MIVQARNPKTDRWIKIDTFTGHIVAHKKSLGPYKNIQVVGGPPKVSFLCRKKISKRKGFQNRGPRKVTFLGRR